MLSDQDEGWMVESLHEIGAASAADDGHHRAFAAGQGLEGRFGSSERRGQIWVFDDFGERAVEITGDEQALGGRQLLDHPSIASRF